MKTILSLMLVSLILTACSSNEEKSSVKNSVNQSVQEKGNLDPAKSF